MRVTHVLLAAALSAPLALPAGALAEPVQDFDVQATPTKTKRPVALSFSTGTRETTPGVLPPTLDRVAVLFPAGSVYNGHLFPTCDSAEISAAKSTDDCPPGSIVGTGKAAGVASGGITQNDLRITVVNGGRTRVNLFVEGASPLRIQSNIIASISKATGSFGVKLSTQIPVNIREPVPGVKVGVSLFTVKVNRTIRVKGRKRGLIEISKCTGGKWKSQGQFTFDTGTTVTVDDELNCSNG